MTLAKGYHADPPHARNLQHFFTQLQCTKYPYTVESLQSHFILTMSHWSSGLPVCFLSQGTQVQIPWGVLMWNRDSPVNVVSLHWWSWRDWSFLWPCLRRASSQTITRPSCWQFDNPTWSHTALLSRFHACCRSPFWLHNWRSRLLGGSPVESLQSHFILTMSHWSSGPPVCFLSQGTRVQISCGVLMWNRDSSVLLVLSRYNTLLFFLTGEDEYSQDRFPVIQYPPFYYYIIFFADFFFSFLLTCTYPLFYWHVFSSLLSHSSVRFSVDLFHLSSTRATFVHWSRTYASMEFRLTNPPTYSIFVLHS